MESLTWKCYKQYKGRIYDLQTAYICGLYESRFTLMMHSKKQRERERERERESNVKEAPVCIYVYGYVYICVYIPMYIQILPHPTDRSSKETPKP